MLTVAVPVAGSVTGDGENEIVEFVVRCGTAGVFTAAGGAGAGVAGGCVAGAAGAGPGAAGVPAGGWPPGPRLEAARSRGFVSEPVLRPRMFTSWMFGMRRMCGVSMTMISVWSRLLCSCENKYLM